MDLKWEEGYDKKQAAKVEHRTLADLLVDAEADSAAYSSVSFVGDRLYYVYSVYKEGEKSNGCIMLMRSIRKLDRWRYWI